MEQLVYRLATSNDLDDLMNVVTQCIQKMNKVGIDQWDDEYPRREDFENDVIAEELYVSTVDSEIIAFASLNSYQEPEYANVDWRFHGEKIAVIHRLMVKPSFQGKKIANSLMSFLESEAVELGYSSMRLDAFSQNPGALKTYQNLGYSRVGEVEFRKGKFVCFEKKL